MKKKELILAVSFLILAFIASSCAVGGGSPPVTTTTSTTTTSTTTTSTTTTSTTTTSTTTTSTIDWRTYYPATEGLVRVYTEQEWEPDAWEENIVTEEVGATTYVASIDVVATALQRTSTGSHEETWADYFITTTSEVDFYEYENDDGGSYSGPIRWLDFPLTVGKRWIIVERPGNLLVTAEAIGEVSVTVPAGTYNAYYISAEGWENDEGEIALFTLHFWYAPNVGLVKRFEVGCAGETLTYVSTSELISVDTP